MRLLACPALVMALAYAGCTVDRVGLRVSAPDSAAADAHHDSESGDASRSDALTPDAHTDERGDGGTARDAGVDAASDADTAIDAGLDAGPEAGPEAGVDAGPEAGTDGDADAGSPFCDSSNPDLVACYRFEGALTDGSSYGNDLSGSDTAFGQGRLGQAVLTSANTSLVAADAPSLDLSAMTLELWVRPDTLPATERTGLLDKGGAYGLFIHPGGDVECKADLPMHARATNVVSAGAWTHVACTYDGSVQRLYIDGTLHEELEASDGIPSTDQALHVGEDGPGGDEQLVGQLDELRIWNASRTAAQVAQAATR